MDNSPSDILFFTSTNCTKFTIINGSARFSENKNNVNIDDCYPLIRFCHTWNLLLYYAFNKPIVLSKDINCLILNYEFNQFLVLTTNLETVTFGGKTAVCVALPKNLISVQFGAFYNENTNPTKKLITLSLGSRFNQPIKISKNIKYIDLGKHFNHRLLLSKHLEYFIISCMFTHPILLPPTLKYLSFGPKINTQKFIYVQQSIKEIEFTCALNLSNKYLVTDELPNGTSQCEIKCYVHDQHGYFYYTVPDADAEFLKCNLPSNTTLRICNK